MSQLLKELYVFPLGTANKNYESFLDSTRNVKKMLLKAVTPSLSGRGGRRIRLFSTTLENFPIEGPIPHGLHMLISGTSFEIISA